MKVLLINPPSEHMITTNIPSLVDEERGYNPPLGLLYVAGYAKTKTAHEIHVLDCQVEEVSQEEVEQRMTVELDPDQVACDAALVARVRTRVRGRFW